MFISRSTRGERERENIQKDFPESENFPKLKKDMNHWIQKEQ